MKNKFFIDCGSHCGESILEAKKRFGDQIKIYSFEANTNLCEELQKHFKNDSNVQIENKAVWIEDSFIKFYISNFWSDGSSLCKEKSSGGVNENIYIEVPSFDLSSFIKNNFSDDDYIILKLDVEGAEYEILNKLIGDGTIHRVNELYGEFHSEKLEKENISILENKIKNYLNKNNIIFNNWELTGDERKVIDRNVWNSNLYISPVTFVIPSRNNLDFLKIAYKSIKDLKGDHYVLILDDASSDGTSEWIESLNDKKLLTYKNPGPERIGIVGMFDKGVEIAKTDIIFAFHADMVASPNLDINILKHLKKGTVVCATRIEPPLHPPGPEKITIPLGNETQEYDYENSKLIFLDLEKSNKNKTTEGIFAPWCMYKEDYIRVGGHDLLFSPQSKEDSDLFNRFLLSGYKLIQSWDGLVYHFTSRGSRFNKHSGGDTGKNSPEWLFTNEKNSKNFIRKWGTFVEHDQLMKPIITPKYDLCFILKNSNEKYLELLEPYCSNLIVDCEIENFISKEQQKTIIDLKQKFISKESQINNDILVYIDCSLLNDKGFSAIVNLPKIISKNISKECEFKLLNSILIKVKNFKTKEVPIRNEK